MESEGSLPYTQDPSLPLSLSRARWIQPIPQPSGIGAFRKIAKIDC